MSKLVATGTYTIIDVNDGVQGPQGPSVIVNANLPEVFTATDGVLDVGQADIVFTALVSGVTTPTYVWKFSGFQTAPTNSGTSTQIITAAQFGTAKAVTVTCTVNGIFVDVVTVARLEKTTAAAGANASGNSGNLLTNAGMYLTADPWSIAPNSFPLYWNLANWCIKDGGAPQGTIGCSTGLPSDPALFLVSSMIPCIPGQLVEFSAYTGAHRCTISIYAECYDSSNTIVDPKIRTID